MASELRIVQDSERGRTSTLSKEFLETLAQEMVLTSSTLKEPMDEMMILGYREALADMRPEQLRRGFRRARRTLKWFPKPNEVRECAIAEFEENLLPGHLFEEPRQQWTEDDRKNFAEGMEQLKLKFSMPAATMNPKEFKGRKKELRKQREQLLSKKE